MRTLIISDIHGNADALRAVVEHAGRWDYLWVLGDLVDYGPEPHTVIDMVRGLGPDISIMGNHDYAVAHNVDCRCAPEIHGLSEYTRRHISNRLLSKDYIEFLKGLSIKVERVVEGKRVLIVHGSPRNPLYGYINPKMDLEEIKLALTPSLFTVRPKPMEVDLIIVGHTHIPMHLTVEGRLIINPGSVGQPRDGDPRASYAILDIEKGVLKIYRVVYDIEKTIRKLEDLSLESSYMLKLKEILRTGKI